ncbi:UDP-2,4-diacetamido-2,4,6-trideoxy-beta-L-altropyranose hydrolase [Sulfurimonas sp.]|uniref:UDP-2,4-diacetamido-2,4, 6-trideoxy-beta-L-altropyranose hydrolase n=1 Tax=Sulfurimonas sp. TaxID=2022749 RepID=UPI003D0A272E
MKNKPLKILFRTDSSAKIGLGHVMRSLTLAKRFHELNGSIELVFAVRNLKGNINKKILKEGFSIHPLSSNKVTELIKLTNKKNFDLVILDSYKIDALFEKKLLHHTKAKVLAFDDTFNQHHANIVLNHGFHIDKSFYNNLLPKTTKLFCGAKYTILRDEFFRKYKATKAHNNIAIMLGGNDTKNLSLKIAKILKKINAKYQISILTTSVNPHIKSLESSKDITLLVDLKSVAKVLAKQNLIICASGGTLFEVMALKKMFINIQVADNQQSIVDYLEKNKIFTSLHQNDIDKTSLTQKIKYVQTHAIYERLKLKFSKYFLAKKILEELK